MTESCQVLVAGAGPAGMMAALFAARRGAEVILCERQPDPGRKLLATGGGRCNATNRAEVPAMMQAYGRSGRFSRPALQFLEPDRLCDLLRELGVPTQAPDGFHVFPESDSARQVRDRLLSAVQSAGVRLWSEAPVQNLVVRQEAVCGARTPSGIVDTERVILATGGRAYPSLGATGDGYRLAAESGHDVARPSPALVPLVAQADWCAELAGVSVPDVHAWIDRPRRRKSGRRGAMLFTHKGVSGPAMLDLSGDVAEELRGEKSVPVRANLCPGESTGTWQERLVAWRGGSPAAPVADLLSEFVPRSLANMLCRLAGQGGDGTASGLSGARVHTLSELLARLELTVVGTRGFEHAMVTRGGVSLKQVDPQDLQSRLVGGLHLAGELLDLDGPCGGYNLQWAFSSGALAGDRAGGAVTG